MYFCAIKYSHLTDCLHLLSLDVEFTMPLRPDNKKKLNTSDEDRGKNSSFDSCYDTMDETKTQESHDKEGSGDEEDPDQFLSQLGLETDIIKKINNTQVHHHHRLFHYLWSRYFSFRSTIMFAFTTHPFTIHPRLLKFPLFILPLSYLKQSE